MTRLPEFGRETNERTIMLEHIAVRTPDMSCGHCVATIEEELGALPGVASVTADLPTKRVEIDFDPSRVTLAEIEETLAEADYPVRVTG